MESLRWNLISVGKGLAAGEIRGYSDNGNNLDIMPYQVLFWEMVVVLIQRTLGALLLHYFVHTIRTIHCTLKT